MKRETYGLLDTLAKGVAVLSVGGFIGAGTGTYHSVREHERQRAMDDLVGDYARACEMQAEAAAMPTG